MARNKLRDTEAAIANRSQMFALQRKELTQTMLEFHHADYTLKVDEDSHGYMTCSIRSRTRPLPGPDYQIRFKKQNGLGVLWTFLNADRLSYLAVEHDHPDLLATSQADNSNGSD